MAAFSPCAMPDNSASGSYIYMSARAFRELFSLEQAHRIYIHQLDPIETQQETCLHNWLNWGTDGWNYLAKVLIVTSKFWILGFPVLVLTLV